MAVLTDKQAYQAMFYFLDQRYQRLKDGALASLLGDVQRIPRLKTTGERPLNLP
jgi:hypothetical protein